MVIGLMTHFDNITVGCLTHYNKCWGFCSTRQDSNSYLHTPPVHFILQYILPGYHLETNKLTQNIDLRGILPTKMYLFI